MELFIVRKVQEASITVHSQAIVQRLREELFLEIKVLQRLRTVAFNPIPACTEGRGGISKRPDDFGL